MPESEKNQKLPPDQIPTQGYWKIWYILVIVWLVVLVLLFYLFTKAFS